MKQIHISLLVAILAGARAASGACIGTGTINLATDAITVDGAIDSDENIIVVTLSTIPTGRWSVTKNERNDTGAPWRGWEIIFGPDTEVPPDAVFSSNFFTQVTAVPSRNALVFHGGEVPPGATLIKSFEVIQLNTGGMVMSHNRSDSDPTPLEIQDGFPGLPLMFCTIQLGSIVPATSFWGLLVAGLMIVTVATHVVRRLPSTLQVER